MVQSTTPAGIIFAFSASIFWSFTPIFFARSGKRLGALSVNVYRLFGASIILSAVTVIFGLFHHVPLYLPCNKTFIFLVISSVLGLVFGDILYLRSLIFIGPRRTTQLLTLSPMMSVAFAWILFGEKINVQVLLGILLITFGLMYIVLFEKKNVHIKTKEPGSFSFKGYLICAIAASCHGLGAVFTRQAFLVSSDLNPLMAASIRLITAAIITCVGLGISGKLAPILKQLPFDRVTFVYLMGGTLSGPVIGMILYISAFKSASAGIVSALSSLSPLFIIPIGSILYRSKISIHIIAATIVVLAGVIIISLFH